MKYSHSTKKREFKFGSYVYFYDHIRQERKTLSLTVTPEMKIFVKSPHVATNERVEKFLVRKWFWLEKQLRYFEKYKRKKYVKEYVTGESFYYLGRQYKLSVKKSAIERVVLSRGLLSVSTARGVRSPGHTKKLLEGWYADKTKDVLYERFIEIKKNFPEVGDARLVIREMKKRWGSYVNNEKVILNPKLIYTSKDCIDYVITHELCHIKHKDHSKKFYELLENKYPDWEKVKERLEYYGAMH